MAAAIDTIAELGYGQASLARIAETAGTSKGVIIYHFGSKEKLFIAVIGRRADELNGRRREARPRPLRGRCLRGLSWLSLRRPSSREAYRGPASGCRPYRRR